VQAARQPTLDTLIALSVAATAAADGLGSNYLGRFGSPRYTSRGRRPGGPASYEGEVAGIPFRPDRTPRVAEAAADRAHQRTGAELPGRSGPGVAGVIRMRRASRDNPERFRKKLEAFQRAEVAECAQDGVIR
jgi:hypothetical protein